MHKFRLRFVIAALVLISLLTVGYFLYMEEQGNFHPITEGEVYRSAQLDRDVLDYYIKKYNIKSIINLMVPGTNKGKCRAQNGNYNLPLSATREPSEEYVRQLMEIFKHTPRPVLIHCQAGADRSGLAAAMWKVVVDKMPKLEARKQLSILYGHIPIGKTSAMDSFFWKMEPCIELNKKCLPERSY